MSEKNILESSPASQKIQDISNYLKSSIISPAEEEKKKIISEAIAERDLILAEAEKKAKEIVEDAQKKAAHEKMTLESTLRISSRQAIDALKHSIINNILTKSISEPLSSSLKNEDVVKSIITEIVTSYVAKGSKENIEISFSDELSKKLTTYIQSEVVEKTKGGINLGSEKIPSGFVLSFKNQQMLFDFSEESLTELLANFVRPELKNIIFGK